MVNGVGPVIAKHLLSNCGNASAVFKTGTSQLRKIPEVSEQVAQSIIRFKDFARAEDEVRFMEQNGIQALFYTDPGYPWRLKSNADCPILLYQRGNTNLNSDRMLAVVGTRMPTDTGRNFCEQLITDLQSEGITVVSGMAYGIDICAHRSALKNHLQTVGVLAHGLDRLYPAAHQKHIREIVDQGGSLITEFTTGTIPDRENFPKRNRIVAGLCDVVVVVETALKGGSMITAELAWQYDRILMALPGRYNDEKSEGCNQLIQSNKAELIRNADDLLKAAGWNKAPKQVRRQVPIPLNLNEKESILMQLLQQKSPRGIDELVLLSGLSSSQTALTLLDLECNGYLKTLPGKQFELL